MESCHLNMEQQFRLQTLSMEVQQMSREQLQEHLIQVLRLSMVRENVIKTMLKGEMSMWPQG